jgi:homoserine dehydrogenase
LSSRLSQSQTSPIYLSLILLARSSKLLYSESFHPLSLSSWEADLQASTLPKLSLLQIAHYLSSATEKVILVDNTSSQEVADCYPLFLKKGINVVTPNKKGFSGSYSLWESIFTAANSPEGGLVFHESSVGAGLPVISTLKDLVDTGDEVQKIEGVFSGTMSFLFNSFAPVGGVGGKFSEEVRKANDLGYMVSALSSGQPIQ